MNKTRIITFIIALSVVVVLLGFFLFSGRDEDKVLPQPVAMEKTSTGLGIIYLPVNRGLSEYYDLGVDNGALVTEVVPGSPAERAGVQAGDVIISFNGAKLEERTPLLGMMMACPAGHTVTMDVWRGTETKMIEIMHRTSED